MFQIGTFSDHLDGVMGSETACISGIFLYYYVMFAVISVYLCECNLYCICSIFCVIVSFSFGISIHFAKVDRVKLSKMCKFAEVFAPISFAAASQLGVARLRLVCVFFLHVAVQNVLHFLPICLNCR